MFEFKDKTQSVADLFTSALTLYRVSLKETWFLTLIIVLATSIIPGMFFNYDGNVVLNKQYMWYYVFYGLFSAGISSFCAGMVMERMFVVGSKAKETMTDSMKSVAEHFMKIAFCLFLISFLTYTGFVFLVLPGIFIGVLFSYVFPLLLLDDLGIKDAFKGSAYLVYDNWFRIFTILSGPYLLVFFSGIIIGIFPGLGGQLLQAIVMWVSLPLLYALILTSFYDSKLRHHMPLHLRIQSKQAKPKKDKAKKASA